MSSVLDVIVAKIWPLRDACKPNRALSLSSFSSSFPERLASVSSALGDLGLEGAANIRGAPSGQYIFRWRDVDSTKKLLRSYSHDKRGTAITTGFPEYSVRQFDFDKFPSSFGTQRSTIPIS